MSDFSKLFQKIKKVEDYMNNKTPTIIGVEAVNHFKESFENQGFTDTNLEKWDDVKRRDSSSRWHGFEYGSNANRIGVKRRKASAMSNYSHAATSRPILSGQSQNLMNSLRWEKRGRGSLITAGTPYAEIQNEGGTIKIFGKKETTMPKRQFMGRSQVLIDKLQNKIKQDLIKILKA